LYSKGGIKEATISITVKEGVRVAISPDIEVIGFLTELPDGIDQVITKTVYTYSTNENWHGDRQNKNQNTKVEVKEDNTLIKDADGSLSDTYGIPYKGTEEQAKAEGYEVITEEEDLERFCASRGCHPDKVPKDIDLFGC
jgi:alanyl-tRNA synthetase